MAADEENDFAAMARYRKEKREERQVKFVNSPVFDQLKDKYIMHWDDDATKFTVFTDTEKHGTIDFFPKANRVLIRKENKWINSGLNWITKNLLNP